VLGTLLHWKMVCVVCASIAVATAASMMMLPETPSWLAVNGKREEAEKVKILPVNIPLSKGNVPSTWTC
jgi:hypothetical protein